MSKNKPALVLVRGGGDLATGVVLRLHRAGIKVAITELPQPLAVRRAVSFAEAVYEGQHTVEGVTARRVERDQLSAVLEADEIPILIDPDADILSFFQFLVVIDGRLTKQTPASLPIEPALHIGLGPGFHAGRDCHAVIETRRSHTLGRVYWSGATQPDSGVPEGDPRRVLRAPSDGIVIGLKQIGDHCDAGETVANIQVDRYTTSTQIHSPLAGVLRGIIREGVPVSRGLKIGDIDPRDDPGACFLVSDKALAIGGGVLEAILSKEEIRKQLWTPSAPDGAPPPNTPSKS
ncbi:MAG: selenium-dependent molybdenum cofactor biosynthesis protein YqeB [Anaerolineales bacterium]